MKRLILIPCLLSLSLAAEAGRRGNVTTSDPPPSSSPRLGGGNDVIYGDGTDAHGGPLYWLRHGYNVITGKRGQNSGCGPFGQFCNPERTGGK